MAVEPSREFGTAVDATGEDGDNCNDQPEDERLEELAVKEIEVSCVPLALVFQDANGEVAGTGSEKYQREDLEPETRQHNILPKVGLISRIGQRGECSSKSLEYETDDITSAENEGVGTGLEEGEVRSVDVDDACEAEVDGGREESRRDG